MLYLSFCILDYRAYLEEFSNLGLIKDQLVILMPDTKVATLKLVLDLSMTGQVVLASKTSMTEVMSVVSSLGMQARLSIDAEKEDGFNEIMEETTDEHVVKIFDKSDHKVSAGLSARKEHSENTSEVFVAIQDYCSGEVEVKHNVEDVNPLAMDHSDVLSDVSMDITENSRDSDVIEIYASEDPEGTNEDAEEELVGLIGPSSAAQRKQLVPFKRPKVSSEKLKKIKCPLCDCLCATYYRLLRHLSRSHYTKQLLTLFGSDRAKCPVCKHTASKNYTQMAVHLGATHEKVLMFVQQAVKAQLDSLRSSGQSQEINKRAWDKCREYFQTKQDKHPCCANFTNSPQELRFHFASVHCSDDLVSAFGEENSQCNYCRIGRGCVAKDKDQIILHMVSSHPLLIYKFMPDYEASLLHHCFQKGKMIKKYKVKRRQQINEKDSGKTQSTDCLICPLCNSLFGQVDHLRRHLCRIHFREEIFHEANVKKGSVKCPDCGHTIRRRDLGELATHLGSNSHGYLDKILPSNIKAALKSMEEKK